jgi:hypothetical protein
MVKYEKAELMRREGGDRNMKTILAALFAVLIGLTFVGSTFADAGKQMGAPATTPVASGEMKKEEGQKVTKAAKKHHRKKHSEEKKEEKK